MWEWNRSRTWNKGWPHGKTKVSQKTFHFCLSKISLSFHRFSKPSCWRCLRSAGRVLVLDIRRGGDTNWTPATGLPRSANRTEGIGKRGKAENQNQCGWEAVAWRKAMRIHSLGQDNILSQHVENSTVIFLRCGYIISLSCNVNVGLINGGPPPLSIFHWK